MYSNIKTFKHSTMALDELIGAEEPVIVLRLMTFAEMLSCVRNYIGDHINVDMFNIKQSQYPFDEDEYRDRYFEDRGVPHYIGIDIDNHENRENLIRLHEYIFIILIFNIHLNAPDIALYALAVEEDVHLNCVIDMMHLLTIQMRIILSPVFPDVFA